MKIGKNNILKVKSIEVFFSYSLKKNQLKHIYLLEKNAYLGFLFHPFILGSLNENFN